MSSLHTTLVIGCFIVAALGIVYLRAQARNNSPTGAGAVDPEFMAAILSGVAPETGDFEHISAEPAEDESAHHAALRARMQETLQAAGERPLTSRVYANAVEELKAILGYSSLPGTE